MISWADSHKHGAAERAVFRSTSALALVMTLYTPQIYRTTDMLLGVPNISRLIATSAMAFAAWTFQPYMSRLMGLPAQRRNRYGRLWLMIGAVIASALLFALIPPQPSDPGGFLTKYAAVPFVAEYNFVIAAYLTVMLYQPFKTAVRTLRGPMQSEISNWFRARLHLSAWGWGLATLATLHVALYPFLIAMGIPYSAGGEVSVALMSISMTIVMGSGLIDPCEALVTYVNASRVEKLALTLDGATSSVFMPAKGFLGLVRAPGGADLALRQRETEVFDSEADIRQCCDVQVAQDAARLCGQLGIRGRQRDAAIDASCLIVGMHNKRAGYKAAFPRKCLERAQGRERTRYLLAVLCAMEHSPVVVQVAKRWCGEEAAYLRDRIT